MTIKQDLIELAQAWNNQSSTLYLVGGCVRDELLNLPIKDYDITSSLLPEQVLQLCNDLNIKATITNESHLVVTISINENEYEHTTFRSESDYDGIHVGTVKASTLEEDAYRRDLTINAIYKDILTGELIDLVNGVNDINSKTLRLISSEKYGNEYQRLWEHGGRYFRLVRFAITKCKDWTIDFSTLEACKRFIPFVFQRGKVESFKEEWIKTKYDWEYLNLLNQFDFLNHYGLGLPTKTEFKSEYAWYYLWKSSNSFYNSSSNSNSDSFSNLDIQSFASNWKLSREEKNIIIDLDKGNQITQEYQWRTTKFKRVSAIEVAKLFNKSFRDLPIMTQGEFCQLNPSLKGKAILDNWILYVKRVYSN
jgi:tRNA nucleotidyltransferase/poly(A) polymerase